VRCLPDGINTDNATATFRDGVLEITMPAPQQETEGRQLQIQEGAAGGQPQSDAQAAGSNR